jgi:hypothetical protein
MDYATLTELIKRYCENEETTFVANIPTFVRLAEQRVYNTVLLPVLRRNKTGGLTGNNQFMTLPTDWLATYSIAVLDPDTAEYQYLLCKDIEFIRESFPLATDTAKPQYYAQFDKDTLIVGPTPDQGYPVQLSYFYYPESIVTASTTWLGDNFDNVLLYGSLREAYLYMKGEKDLLDGYEQKYQEGMALLKTLGETKNTRDLYRPMR